VVALLGWLRGCQAVPPPTRTTPTTPLDVLLKGQFSRLEASSMTRLRHNLSTILVLGGLFALTACGGSTSTAGGNPGATGVSTSTGAAASTTLAVGVTNGQLKFDQATLTVKAGQSVTVTFNNTDPSLAHSFVMDQPKVAIPQQDPAAGLVAGKSDTTTLTAPAAGTYQYYCAVPGHKEAGMMGTLQVTQ
jgi:uncharacterized cupredoxin-like copper-binding protein